jgi:hypothetical protein
VPGLADDQSFDMASFEKILHAQTLGKVRTRFLEEVLNGSGANAALDEDQGGSVELF